MGLFYYRVYNGIGQLLISTRSLDFAKTVLYTSDPSEGPYHFYVGGFAEGVVPAISEMRCFQ